MRRSALVVSIVVAATLFAIPSAGAEVAIAAPDAVAEAGACIAAAQAAGAAPAAAASGCLDGAEWTVYPASSDALAVTCVQAVQTPYKFAIGLIGWGTLIICDQTFVGAGAGTLYWNGLPVAASAGPSNVPILGIPGLPSSVQFWSTVSPCLLTGTYQSSVLAVVVTLSGQTAILGSDASSTRFLACP